MSTRKILTGRPRVIVRAWGDEPVELCAHAIDFDKDRVLVGSAMADRPISLPSSDVFPYDDTVFDVMRMAHSAGDHQKLIKLYEEAGRSKKTLQ